MNQLITVESSIYIPKFDENNDCYLDSSPYKPYERNCVRYECRCKAGSYFVNNMMFKQHIKSKTHKEFITNYKKYFKEVDEATETINDLKVENELLKRKLKKYQKIIEMLDEEQFDDCD
jgi:hypothetical protein